MKKITIILLVIIFTLCCAFGFVACDNDSDVSGVSLNKTTLTLNVGDEDTLVATVEPDNASNKTVAWSVEPTGVVTVDNNGKVTAIAVGSATITATAGGKSATCSVTVNAAKPKSEVTASEWESIMSRETTLTFEMYDSNDVVASIKIDGDRRLLDYGYAKQLYSKEGDMYFEYQWYPNTDWKRMDLKESNFKAYTELYEKCLSLFKDDYSAFTFDNGIYVCPSLDKTTYIYGGSLGMLENIEIAFDNGAVISVTFNVENGYYCEIKNIGNTTVELPTSYTV